MLLRNPTLLLLFCGQALYWSCSLIGITLTALVGVHLAPLNSLATLPLALLVLGNLLAVQPLSHFMQRHGRRPGLMLGAGGGVLGGLVCAAGVWTGDFLWFCLGALGIGVYQASAMYYRFAALEAVDAGRKGRASAYVLAGGVLAALLAPSLALWSRNALAQPFVGAYLLIAVLALAGLLLMALLREGQAPRPARLAWRDIGGLLRRPVLRAAIACTAAGHGLMILIMNATPLAMSFCGLPLEQSSRVIQWHVLGMFLPAFLRRTAGRPHRQPSRRPARRVPARRKCRHRPGRAVGHAFPAQFAGPGQRLEPDAHRRHHPARRGPRRKRARRRARIDGARQQPGGGADVVRLRRPDHQPWLERGEPAGLAGAAGGAGTALAVRRTRTLSR